MVEYLYREVVQPVQVHVQGLPRGEVLHSAAGPPHAPQRHSQHDAQGRRQSEKKGEYLGH